jgi:ABC-type phosphate transport system permease subunit
MAISTPTIFRKERRALRTGEAMSDKHDLRNGIIYTLTMVVLGVTVWALAKYISIPVGLGVAVYLLKPNHRDVKDQGKL